MSLSCSLAIAAENDALAQTSETAEPQPPPAFELAADEAPNADASMPPEARTNKAPQPHVAGGPPATKSDSSALTSSANKSPAPTASTRHTRYCGFDALWMHGAVPDPSGSHTQLHTRVGGRIRHRTVDASGGFGGRELTFWFHRDTQGTTAAAVDRNVWGVDARLVGGRSFGTRFFQVSPYSFVQGGGSGGWVDLRVGETHRIRLAGSLALGLGGGLEYSLGPVDLRVELGFGLRNIRPELFSTLSLGWGHVPIRPAVAQDGQAGAETKDDVNDTSVAPGYCLSL